MRVIAGIIVAFIIFSAASVTSASHNININTASAAELQTLTGIGEVKAQAIVDYRENNGSFSSISEIQNVSGIGDATYESIKDHITVGDIDDSDNGSRETESDSDSDNGSEDEDSNGSSGDYHWPVDGLLIEAPPVGYVNQLIQFDVEPTDGTSGRLIRYNWSFGDMTTADNKTPEHSYAYPGTYVVVVESRYLKEIKMARHEIEILSAALSIERALNGDATITNDSEYEIDLGGMSIAGSKTVVFPKYTILLPGKSLTVSNNNLKASSGRIIVLRDEAGAIVSTHRLVSEVPSAVSVPSSDLVTLETDEAVEAEFDETATSSISVATSSGQVAAAGSAGGRNLPAGSLPYLGLIGVLSVALVSVYIGRASDHT